MRPIPVIQTQNLRQSRHPALRRIHLPHPRRPHRQRLPGQFPSALTPATLLKYRKQPQPPTPSVLQSPQQLLSPALQKQLPILIQTVHQHPTQELHPLRPQVNRAATQVSKVVRARRTTLLVAHRLFHRFNPVILLVLPSPILHRLGPRLNPAATRLLQRQVQLQRLTPPTVPRGYLHGIQPMSPQDCLR